MIRSMTGFGDASEQLDQVHYAVEVRSLNNRFFKGVIRLPDRISGLEAEIESALRQKFNRGSITCTVGMRASGAGAAQGINDAALIAYLDHLESIHEKFSQKDRAISIDLTALLALPGVLQQSDEEELLRRARPVVLGLLEKACEKLQAMRVREGQSVAGDLFRQRDVMRSRLDTIRNRAPQVIDEYHQRLRARVDELLKEAKLAVDQRDLIREVAIFADRSDIAEEISRLAGHLEQFEQIISAKNGDPAGRTLEFLTQEMLREANTIASKSNDATISRAVVEIKSAIDRIKEQSQNVE